MSTGSKTWRDRLQPWHGGAALLGLGFAYMVIALISGHEARAEPPLDLAARGADAGLELRKAAALVVEGATVVDLRDEPAFARAHVPGARPMPGADADALRPLLAAGPLLLVADQDADALRLSGALRGADAEAPAYFLKGGMRAWYLALELPVPLFSAKVPPYGYEPALQALQAFLAEPGDARRDAARQALQTLARLDYQPELLGQAKKPKAAGPRKKISGGCG